MTRINNNLYFDNDNIIDKIDKIEKYVLTTKKTMPEFLILDQISYEQLLYERDAKNIEIYHGYIIAVIRNEDYQETIRFI